ncbi:MAG: hypothetical protein AAGC97_16030 [Planctomycetota bacterium]
MLEVFALPYFAVSGVIGWFIFAPFFRVDSSESLSRSSITISDLLAISIPVSVLFSAASWMMPVSIASPWVQAIVIATAFGFAATALTAGLFLVPKTIEVTSLKRMTIVGIIAPFGILLMVGWIGFLIWACVVSIVYLAPSMIAIAAVTAGLRGLSRWACQPKKPSGGVSLSDVDG